uniref:Prolylcarboxypeptidase n=1 Tax=Heterorhabditis bacteriophora TaxID=37862 RepID=A0A2P1N6U8_HETBA|nr:prolylcarboxypeptidase [Heterorhabditis bacteriophora]
MRLAYLLGLITLISARRHPSLPPYLFGRPTSGGFTNHGLYLQDASLGSIQGPNISIHLFNQKIDHFSSSNETFEQRYWHNLNYSKDKNIIFLLIQGESVATDVWVKNPNITYLKLAQKFGAHVFQLEHRCFGFSRPYPDLSFPHLSTCTVDQALEDIHTFIQAKNAYFKYSNPKWIIFGGSYPGSLAALFRMKYPNDTKGAIASSAPMLWTLDFFQYAQVMNDVLEETDPNCKRAVEDAFTTMQELSLTNNGRDLLNYYFNLKPPFVANRTTQHDVDNFFANVFTFFQEVIQYSYNGMNNATRAGLGVLKLCEHMTDSHRYPDVVVRVNNTINWINDMDGQPRQPFANSYSEMIKVLSNVTFDDEDPYQLNAAIRGWLWLCCNELGVLQSTNLGRNVFQQIIPLNYYVDMCTETFDPSVNIEYIRDRNRKTLTKFGGADGYKATNVVLPNGSIDPWHVLGTYKSDEENHQIPILIEGTAHCADMYPAYNGEPKALESVRKTIEKEIAYFLDVN